MKFHRIVPLLLVLAIVLPSWAFAQPQTVSQNAALMDSPKGKQIGRVQAGAQVDQIATQDDMAQVILIGWVQRSAFKKVPSLLARVKILEVVEPDAELKSEPGGRSWARLSKEAHPEMRDIKGKCIKVGLTAWASGSSMAAPAEKTGGSARVRLSTNHGDIVIELDPQRAPRTVANFDSYVEKGHYDGTIFHRVIENFMVQGGGFDASYSQKPTDPPIPIESNNGLKNLRGTVAMARTNDPNSATSQFFINVVDNAFLNYQSDASPGYTVFGRVVSGMDVVDQIRKIPTTSAGPFPSDVPQTVVVITKSTREE